MGRLHRVLHLLALVTALMGQPALLAAQDTETVAGDRGYLTNLIENSLSAAGRQVTITGFEGALAAQARIAQITIADSDGVWATLDDVVLEWNRAALLRGAIDVGQLRAARVQIARAPLPAPNAAPTPEARPFALPELPVSIALDALQIDRLELPADLVGSTVALQVAGSASLAAGAGRADLRASRLDGRLGDFALTGSYDNTSRNLALSLDLTEGQGGVVAGLLGLRDQPAVALRLAGAGPLDDFAADLTLASAGVERLRGAVSRRKDALGDSVTRLDLTGDIAPLVAAPYAGFFGAQTRVQAALRQGIDGALALDDLLVDAGRLQLRGALAIGADGWPARVQLSGGITQAIGGAPVRLPIAGASMLVQGVSLRANFDAAQSDRWQMDMALTGLARDGFVLDDLLLRGAGQISAPSFDADITWAGSGIGFADDAAARAFGDQISGALRLSRVAGAPMQMREVSLVGAGLDLRASGQIAGPDDGFAASGDIALQIAGLDRFSALAARPLGGGANVVIRAQAVPRAGSFALDLDGQAQDLRLGVDQLDPLLQGASQISARLIRDSDGIRLPAITARSAAGAIRGRGQWASSGASAQIVADLVDLAPVVAGLDGPARLIADLRRDSAGALAFDLSGSGPAARYRATGAWSAQGAQALTLAGNLAISDLSRYADLAGHPLAGAAALDISGMVLGDGQRFTLSLAGQSDDLSTGNPLLDPLLSGAGQIRANLARLGPQRLRLSDLVLQTDALDLRGMADLRAIGAARADLTARITDMALLDPALSGPADLRLLASPQGGGISAASAQISAQGVNVALMGDLADAAGDFALTGDLRASVQDLGTYAALLGRPLSGQFDLTASGVVLPDLSRFDGQVQVQSTDLALGNPSLDALLAGAGRIDAQLGRADGVLAVRTLEILTPQVSIVGALNGNAGFGQGRFNASLRDIGVLTEQISGPVRARGSASLDSAGNWGIDATGTGPGGLAAAVRGFVDSAGRLDLDMDGSAPLALANTAIAPRRLSGTASFDLRADGPAGLDALSGRIALANGRLAAPTLGQAFSELTGAVNLQGGTARVDLRAAVAAGGSAALVGPVGLGAGLPADLTLQLTDAVVKDPALYRTSLTGALTLNGPLLGGARIAGQLALGQTDLQVPSSAISALGALPDVRHVGPDAAVRETLLRAGLLANGARPVAPGSARRAYDLDIAIAAPGRIFIRGRGLDAELGGSLTIGGTSATMLPVGQFDLLRGRIDILQQRFDLTEGVAALEGDFIPFIRLAAATQSPTGTAITIVVEGLASAPAISFESVPDLPQDEILAQLIFGRDLQSISALQAVQLAAAINTLAGGSAGAVDQLRRNIGLDDFDVTTDAAGNAAVRAGKYLSENVYTDVTISSDGSTQINLNLDITDDVVAKGSLGADGNTRLGVFFERDY